MDGASGADDLPFPTGYFTRNDGQVRNPKVLFYHTSKGMQVGFTESGLLIKVMEEPTPDPEGPGRETALQRSPAAASRLVDGVVVSATFAGANPSRPIGIGELSFPSHFLIGTDPSRWRRDVPSFREILYPDIYNGIDLVYRVGPGGVKYEFRCQPGSDPERIEIAYEGNEGLRIDSKGNLFVRTAVGDVRDSPPVSYRPNVQLEASTGGTDLSGDGPEEEVRSRYVLRSASSIGFDVEGWDGESLLVIDPLIYSTYLGAERTEYIRGIDVDADGFAYVTGWTISEEFPVTKGAFRTVYTKTMESFVVKIKQRGKDIFFATYFGGDDQDDAFAIHLDQNRDIYIAGITKSTDLPVTDGSTHGGGLFDAFIAKVDNRGKNLLYAGYFGGSDDDYGYDLAIDAVGAGYLVGFTRSADLPVTPGAFDTTFHGGGFDGYLAKVDTVSGSHVYATYLGGRSVDFVWSVAIDSAREVYVTGSTLSPDFPVTAGSFGPTYGGGQDSFVAKVNATGGGLVYGGFLGGSAFDRGYTIGVDGSGAAYAGGVTRSIDFPTTEGAFDETYAGGDDAFVVKVNPAGSALAYSTYLGGIDFDEVRALQVDATGETHLTGITASSDFPVTAGAYDETHNGGQDAFLSRLVDDGSGLAVSSYLGGSDRDQGLAIVIDFEGNLLVGGETRSPDFPVTEKVFDPQLDGVRDGFITKLTP